LADAERLAQVGGTEHARCDLRPVEVRVEAHLGVLGPVVPGPEVEGLAAVPVPGAHHGLGALDADRLLDAGPELGVHRLAEVDHDGDADAVGPAPEDGAGGERPGGALGLERARGGGCLAVGAACGDGHRVAGRRVQRVYGVPGRLALQGAGGVDVARGDADV